MRVRDLGPLLVECDGRDQPVVGTKGSAMLAMLAINVNQLVSTDALTEAAWGDHVSSRAASTLLSHVWRLRQLLEPNRRSGEPARVLVNDAGGYRLLASAATLDSLFFAEACAQVRDLVRSGSLPDALHLADDALARWRGRPYGPAADAGWAQPAVARLDELHAQLQERRIVALVGLGALDTALSDLQPLIAALPFHETLRLLQMEALHRSGRTEQALEAFRETRRILVEEVGIEPGRDLQTLHRRILDGDPDLAGPPLVVSRPAPESLGAPADPRTVDHPAGGEIHLPTTMTSLVGRDAAVAQLQRLVSANGLVTITGPAGSGKTRVAVEVARSLAPTFVDGVWFVDLVTVDDARLVVDVVIATIGFVPSADAAPVEDLRQYLRSREVLLVLDNCEHVLDAVRAMVSVVLSDAPVDGRRGLLTTSRERLGVDGEIAWSLDPLELPDPTAPSDAAGASAMQLFLERVRAASPTLTLDDGAVDDAARICIALDGLPLPLELAAARTPAFSLAEIADQVRTDPTRLRRPGARGKDHRSTLRSTIDWSYRLLAETEQAAHRQLSVLPGPFTEGAAVEVLGGDTLAAENTLIELVYRSVLSPVGARRRGGPTAFRQLATVRSHARHALDEYGDAAATLDRRDQFSCHLIGARPPLGTQAEPRWYDLLTDDYATVRATLTRQLIEQPTAHGGLLAARLPYYWYYREHLAEATRWLLLGHDLLLDSDPHDLAVARAGLVGILLVQGRVAQARPYLDALLAFEPDPRDPRLAALAEAVVGVVGSNWINDEHALVVRTHDHLAHLVDGLDSPHVQLLTDATGALATAARGRLAEAVDQSVDVYERAIAADVPMAIWLAAGAPLAHALFSGDPAAGIPWSERCMSAHFRFGTGAGGAFIESRANFAVQQRDLPLAAMLYSAAYSITRRVGMKWPWRQLSVDLLERAKAALGEEAFATAWRSGERLTPLDVLEHLRTSSADRGVLDGMA